MIRYEKVKNMSIDELAKFIIEFDKEKMDDEFCRACKEQDEEEGCFHDNCAYTDKDEHVAKFWLEKEMV